MIDAPGDAPGRPVPSLLAHAGRAADRALGLVAAATLFAMMALAFVDVWGRYLLRQPVFGSYEITEFMMGVLIFTSLPLLCAREGHVTIDLLDGVIPEGWRRWQRGLTNLVSALVLGAIAWRLLVQAQEHRLSHEVTMTLKIPHWPFGLLFAAMAGLAVIACLVRGWVHLANLERST
ncbi:MAG: TRAP transporter small permease [Candidatus Rokuibacteriota bacterium]